MVTGYPQIFDKVSVGVVVVSLAAIWQAIATALASRRQANELASKRVVLEARTATLPSDPKTAWDLARVTLEQYFYRNLSQVTQIFYVAVLVMLVGFGLILYGAYLAIHQGDAGDLASKLSAVSGIITEFISVTVMVIYRSTLQQANGYMVILEKINAVGMAVQIVETIPKDDPLYVPTRSAMAKMLLEQFKQAPIHQSSNATTKSKGR